MIECAKCSNFSLIRLAGAPVLMQFLSFSAKTVCPPRNKISSPLTVIAKESEKSTKNTADKVNKAAYAISGHLRSWDNLVNRSKRASSVECRMTISPILLIHGGAGDINDARVPGKLEGMKAALRASIHHLRPTDGAAGSALDAVEAAVRAMELDENFNAGYGACLNSDGNVEVEASIMEGEKLRAGCVTLLHDIMHPISVARRVMEQTNHTFLGGQSAQQFALKQGFEELPQGSLVTESARVALAKFKEQQAKGEDTTFAATELHRQERPGEPGTVGAVAIDSKGNIAVATSTGGITGKVPGRIGDTPLLGCGTYADNLVGGVSTTGHGETIMRYNLAQRILEKIRCGNLSAQEATEAACKEMTERLVGTGGAITIDAKGELGMHWTSKRMAWAYVRGNELCCGIDHGKEFKETL